MTYQSLTQFAPGSQMAWAGDTELTVGQHCGSGRSLVERISLNLPRVREVYSMIRRTDTRDRVCW